MDFWCDPDDDDRRPCLSEEEVANNMCRAIPSERDTIGARIPSVTRARIPSGGSSVVREDKSSMASPSSSLSPPDPCHDSRQLLILATDYRQRSAGCHK